MGAGIGVGPHGSNARELALMVEHGMTPMQAIVASTRSVAELLHLDDRLGMLVPGKLADLLLVDGDPLAESRILAESGKLALVIKGGALVGARRAVTVGV